MANARVGNTIEKFQPVEIIVTLQTQRELDLFGAIFNFGPFVEIGGVDDNWCVPIRRAAERAGANIHAPIREFANKFKK